MGRPSNTDERRQQIVGALMRVLAEVGYARATVAAIAREAGLAPGLVHYHFGSKQEILVALVAELATRLRARASSRLARAGDGPRARLGAFLHAHLGRGRGEDPEAVRCWVALAGEAIQRPEVGEVYRDALEARRAELEALVGACLAEVGGDRSRARPLAAMVLAAIEGSYTVGCAAPGTMPRGAAARTLEEMLWAAIAASAASTTPRPGRTVGVRRRER